MAPGLRPLADDYCASSQYLLPDENHPLQDQRRPDVIEKLHGDEQNPERDFVSLSLSCESDAVMPDKHCFS